MVENIEPVGEDFSKSIEDLAEHAGEVALEIYRAQLDGKDLVLNMGYSHPVKMITIMMFQSKPILL